MPLHRYRILAPGNDLHNEEITIDDPSREKADRRAAVCVRETFGLSNRRSVSIVHVASYASRENYRKARDVARESGVRLTDSDVDAVIDILLRDDLDDESTPCISSGCDVRVEPGESADADVAVCRDCYGEGRQAS